MPTSDGKNCERGMTGEGVGVPDSGRAKRTPEFTEKNFRWQNIFSLAVFLLNPAISNETPAAKFRLTRKPRVWFSRFETLVHSFRAY
jgi:hypothetical protein